MCCVMLVCFWLSVFVLKMWMDDLFTADQIFLWTKVSNLNLVTAHKEVQS